MNRSRPELASPPRRFRWSTALLIGVLAALLLGIAAWNSRAPLLQGAARLWIVDAGPLAAADAVVVLGGGTDTRPFAAAEYYHRGLTRRILVSDMRPSRAERLGLFPPEPDFDQQVLTQLGVPANAIATLGTENRNTHEEALALRQWVDRTHARNVIVPTEIFSARRVKWTMEAALAGSGARVQVPVLETEDYTRNDWWQSAPGLITFQNEVLKYAYYRFKYRNVAGN